MAKQYCRYCSYCTCGDWWYCDYYEKFFDNERQVKRANKCKHFDLSPLGDAESGLPYKPRKPKAKPKPLDCKPLF